MHVQKDSLPAISLLQKEHYQYADCFKGSFQDPNDQVDLHTLVRAFFASSPRWVSGLLTFRNRIVAVFGLKTGQKMDPEAALEAFRGEPGEQLGLFKVHAKTDKELILGEDDKHLNFRVSLLLEHVEEEGRKNLTFTTVVHFNNWFGRLYFFVIKPFHRVIVPAMLRATIRNIERHSSRKS